jgi:lipid-A-disaccharide synthase
LKYYIIAGEASGDLHASNLMRAIRKKDESAEFRFWGGDLMQQQGGELVRHYRDLAFMGFVEVLLNIFTIFRNLSFCKKDIVSWEPDVVILVDYPGFNLRVAEFLHKKGIKVIYYISPQVWAWKQGRVKKIRKVVDKMLVILPFEKDFYKKYGMEVDFVGHPLLDALQQEKHLPEETLREKNGLGDRPLIALLPGSRKQEVAKMLSVMLQTVPFFDNYQFVVCGVSTLGEAFYKEIIDKNMAGDDNNVKVLFDQTHDVLFHATAALVTSGTATLETALIGTPEVVCYKGGRISYEIAKRVIKVDYISLVNLIMDKLVVKELIQDEFNVANLRSELKMLTENKDYRERILKDYETLRVKLGKSGASEKAAGIIVDFVKEHSSK